MSKHRMRCSSGGKWGEIEGRIVGIGDGWRCRGCLIHGLKVGEMDTRMEKGS